MQSYKFKIYLRRTESSMIDNKAAKVAAYLCSESCKKMWCYELMCFDVF